MLARAVRRLRNRADAEDAVQESCVRAWLGFEGLRSEESIRFWLYRILASVLNDWHEKAGRRDQLLPILALDSYAGVAAAADQEDPLELLLSAASTDGVHEVLRLIPEEFAAALRLHDIEGFRYQEIADIAGVPVGTVMSRIHRARRMLAGIITAHAPRWDLRERGLPGGIFGATIPARTLVLPGHSAAGSRSPTQVRRARSSEIEAGDRRRSAPHAPDEADPWMKRASAGS